MTQTVTEIPRDQWGRPLIIPLDGGKPVGYTRVSTLAKALDDLNNLMAWKQRMTVIGVLRRPDLLTRTAGAIANGDPDVDWRVKKDLNNICEEATQAAGATTGRSAGTGFHALTEAIDRGEEPRFVPEADKPRLDAYRAAMGGYEALDSETFVVCDPIQSAGSFDRLWRCPDGAVRVGDLKSGKSEKAFPLSTTTQLAIYSNAKRYNPETGARTDLHPDLDLTTALLIHMPASGGCEVVPLDIEKGWQAAQLAAQVHHEVRKWKAVDLILNTSSWEVA